MRAARVVGARIIGGLRELERHWIRPLGQRLRPPRARRQEARSGCAEAEELIVALLRARLRGSDAAATSTDDPLGALSRSSELGTLLRALVTVPPRRIVAESEPERQVP